MQLPSGVTVLHCTMWPLRNVHVSSVADQCAAGTNGQEARQRYAGPTSQRQMPQVSPTFAGSHNSGADLATDRISKIPELCRLS